MKYFKFAFLSIYDSLIMNSLIILELAIVFLGINLAVSSYNNRYMLYEPYKNILESRSGWYLISDFDENTDEMLKNELKGDLSEVRLYSYYGNANFKGNVMPVRITVCPDEIINHMKLPVYSGKWETASSEKIVCIAAPNIYGVLSGDNIDIQGFASGIIVSGVLTDPCYIPSFDSWKTNAGIENFYRKYSVIYRDNSADIEALELIMSESEFLKTGATLEQVQSSLIIYGEEPLSENIEYNEKVIFDNYQSGIPLSAIKKRTLRSIDSIMRKYTPLLICMAVVLMIGFMSCTSINTLRNIKNYGVLFICGMKWRDCIKICMAYTLIVISLAASLTMIAVSFLKVINIASYLGLYFKMNNIVVSLLVLLGVFILNVIIPILIIKHKTPVEILRENNK